MSGAAPAASGLATFNTADAGEARVRLLSVTASPTWAEEPLADRPFSDFDRVLARSDKILRGVGEDQVDAALAGHPRIGKRANAQHFGGKSAARSAREQDGVDSADEAQKQELAAVNAAYEQRFGRVYLVAAAGLSASELPAMGKARLENPPAAELDVVPTELAKITRSRLTDWLSR